MFTLNVNYKNGRSITKVDEPRLVLNYNARKHRTMRSADITSRDHRKTFGHSVQREKNRWSGKI